MNSESANKFISALVKALQTLCHGYVEFNDGIEIIGHIYLNIDSGSSFDYVVKEKLCKNAENSTVFVSKSFQAQAPPDECLSRKERDDDQAAAFEDSSMSPSGTARLQSAITSISNVLSGAQEIHKSRLLDHASHSAPQNTGKRKREHNGSYSNMQPPLKYTTLHTSSTSSSYFSSVPLSKQAADRNHSEHFSSASHAEFFGGDSNQSSGMGQEDEDDLHLDVTFVKEEYESQRNSSQRGVSGNAASRLSQDLSSNQSNMLHDGTPRGGTLGYSSSHHQLPQQFASGTAGDMGSLNQGFQDSSQVDVDQHTGQRPPNPRTSLALPDPTSANCLVSPPSAKGSAFELSATAHLQSQVLRRQRGSELLHTVRQTKWAVARARDDATAGPPVRMPQGVKPLCGYVHPDDAKKWMMYELLPGSGVYIHQENYNVVMSKTRQGQPDGKAMARYLMSCFWRQSELVGASIAEPPKPHQRSLDRGIIHAILGFSQHHSQELPTDILRTMQQKIGFAKFYFVKKSQDPHSPKTTPASISWEASPRRMSMEMALRGAGGLPLNLPVKMPSTGKRRKRTSSRGLRESDDISRIPQRATPGLSSRSDISSRVSDDSGRLAAPSNDMLSDRQTTDISCRHMVVGIVRRMSADLTSRISRDFSSHMSRDLPHQASNDPSGQLPDGLTLRTASNLSARSSEISANSMSTGATLEAVSERTPENSLSELANRMGSVPAGMSRGFLDMLNNIYPSN